MKFKTQFSPSYQADSGEINSQELITVPDMALTIREILDRYASGMDPQIAHSAYYELNEDSEDFDLDISVEDGSYDLADYSADIDAIHKRKRIFEEEKRKQKAEKQVFKKVKEDEEEQSKSNSLGGKTDERNVES